MRWTQEESEALVTKLVQERDTAPLRGRSRKDCERQWRNILEYIFEDILEAKRKFHKENPRFDRSYVERVLSDPYLNYDEEVYYGVLAEAFKVDAKSLVDGIHKKVGRYHAKPTNQDMSLIEYLFLRAGVFFWGTVAGQ